MIRKYLFILLFIFISVYCSKSQQPAYTHITTEEGLPSNEIYSIVQDNKGIIWIGCDAGLFKYDGINFTLFKCPSQKTKSITGLSISNSGKLYCYSFNGQLFYLENESLHELAHPFGKISNIVCDTKFQLYLNHNNGIAVYDERKKEWINFDDFDNDNAKDSLLFTLGICIDKNKDPWFIAAQAICKLNDKKVEFFSFPFDKKKPSGEFLLACNNQGVWVFGRKDALVYQFTKNKFEPYSSFRLTNELKNRKITYVKSFNDNLLYICTYTGIILYNTKTDELKILYPYYSVSDCFFDRENNFWITTLQNGLLKVPDLNFTVWNSENKSLEHDLLYKMSFHDNLLYFATVDGYVGLLNLKTEKLSQFQSEVQGDIQQLTYDSIDKKTYYTINNSLYYYNESSTGKIENSFPPIKSFFHLRGNYIVATSRGTFVYNSLIAKFPIDTITEEWSRNIQYNPYSNDLWLATNNGLVKVKYVDNHYKSIATYFQGIQIVSSYFDESSKKIVALTFDGIIKQIDQKNEAKDICSLPVGIQSYQLLVYKSNIYIASNKGLYVYDAIKKKWNSINKTGGLVSENVQQVAIINNFIWLATGKGLQRIPLDFNINKPLSKVFLRKVIADTLELKSVSAIRINYNQSLSFFLEASAYSSADKFQYAYRIQNNDTNWVYFPSNIKKIEIPQLPSGNNSIEIKLIDYLGRDSENVISIQCYVNPPFWQKWWFNLLIGVFVLLLAYIVFRKRINYLKQKQSKEIEQLRLENELRLTQQSALKAQMNPHFIFNVLNSIKGYIYENDKKNAALYLTSFSDLVRKVLQQSSVAEIKLEEELEILKLYIELESMLLQDDFEYTLSVNDAIDISTVKIPGLIIQPFVENAFKHGLRHKSGNKKLVLNFNYNDNKSCLIISITDNGIGREAAAKLNSERVMEHQSFATEATARRIELLNHNKKDVISFKIIDNADEQQNATGTSIVLTIRLNDN